MIKRLLLMISATALLATTLGAQIAQPSTQMTIPEFRQVLIDLGTYLDAHKGTNLASQFSTMSDEQLSSILPSVGNPLQLKNAVEALKQNDIAVANGSTPALRGLSVPHASLATPNAVVGSCQPDSIIDNSSGAQCTPAYPDPNNTAWQNLVNPLITFGAFTPTDYPSVSSQQCSLTVESNLVQVVSALNGTVTVAAIGCGALTILAEPVCDAAVAVVGVAGAVSQGLLADCSEQDGNVNGAEIDAAFHNTVTIFNNLNGLGTQIGNDFTNVSNEFSSASTQLTGVNTQITGEFNAIDTHLTNVDNHVAVEFATLSTQIVTLVNQLQNQVAQSTALANADLRQVMKLEMTPDGLKKIDPTILTCSGADCPNVLANCPAAGCSWNNVGPLP